MASCRGMGRYDALDWALRHNALPDPALVLGSRAGIRLRERREQRGGIERQEERLNALREHMSTGPVAEMTDAANAQHYELPAAFFTLFLGPRNKNWCALCATPDADLAGAEAAMLKLTCERAQVQ